MKRSKLLVVVVTDGLDVTEGERAKNDIDCWTAGMEHLLRSTAVDTLTLIWPPQSTPVSQKESGWVQNRTLKVMILAGERQRRGENYDGRNAVRIRPLARPSFIFYYSPYLASATMDRGK